MLFLQVLFFHLLLSRQNQTQEQKAADVKKKSIKRAAEREKKAPSQTDDNWIYNLVNTLVLDVPIKYEQLKIVRELKK